MVTDKGGVAISGSRSLVCNRDFVLRAVRRARRSRTPWRHIMRSQLLHGRSFADHGPFGFVYRRRICDLLVLWVLP